MPKILVFILLSLFASHLAWAQSVSGKHLEKNVTCANCHQTATPTKAAPASACAQCHGDYAKVANLTKDVKPNPHQAHTGEIRCTLCHKTHEPSVLYCNECHQFEMKVK